ncbi:hypothetical protein PLICRDRAFT_244170 [Plicaturopsis crispa FD-325 SS-3]|nr:hypothetical protein PLICRDRAFT_244170 [Plicaturopsis crispa FD-325 SS-3]
MDQRASRPQGEATHDHGSFKDRVRAEAAYQSAMDLSFDSERTAYHNLRDFQGTSLVQYYRSATLVLPADSRAFTPHVALFEYVPGQNLHDVDPTSISGPLAQTLIDTVSAFDRLGVIHDDIRPENILFYTPAEGPMRALIIDFGSAGTREDDCSEENWRDFVGKYDDVGSLIKVLDRARMRWSS